VGKIIWSLDQDGAVLRVARLHAMFIVDRDGLTLFSWNLTPERINSDLVTSFLTAVRSLVKEISPEEEKGLRSIEAHGFTILLEAGEKVFGALFLDQEDPIARECLRAMVREFERRYSSILEAWDGDVSVFEPFEKVCSRILSVIALGPYHVPRFGKGPDEQVVLPRSLWLVLRFVDGRRTIAEIAEAAGLSVDEAVERLKMLLDMGLVDVDLAEPMRAVVEAYEEAIGAYEEALEKLLGRKLVDKLVASALKEWEGGWLKRGIDGRLHVQDVERMSWLHVPKEAADMLEPFLDKLCQEARPILGELADAVKNKVLDDLMARHGEALTRFGAGGYWWITS